MKLHPPSLKTWSALPLNPDGESGQMTVARTACGLAVLGASIAALLATLVGGHVWWGLGLCGVAVGLMLARLAVVRQSELVASYLLPRMLILLTVAAAYVLRRPDERWLVALCLAVGLVVALGESFLGTTLGRQGIVAAHLPGVAEVRPPRIHRNVVPAAWWVGLAAGVALTVTRTHPLVWLIVTVLLGLVPLVAMLDGLQRMARNAAARRGLGAAVAAYAPEFAIYAGRPDEASYQVTMWLDYLRRTGRRFVIITKASGPAATLATLTDNPVICCSSVSDIEQVLVPSLRAVFYVNASSANGQLVRYQHLTHVYVGHGDSDKAPSYNPTHAMYDYIFAAGPAAIDRYAAHGVTIDRSKFMVVGRPQVELVQRARPAGERGPQTVLYAPTWRGHVDETNLYSLPHGEAMVKELLSRGMTVIFRPHPFNLDFPDDAETVTRIDDLLRSDAHKTGRRHVWGEQAQRTMSIFDCFNASDAMISDVSSVVSDYLFSAKPFAMYSVSESHATFVEEFPVARASYVIDPDVSNLSTVLDELLGEDSRAATRESVRAYYLGDFPEEGYSDNFVEGARAVIDGAAGQPRRAGDAALAAGHPAPAGPTSSTPETGEEDDDDLGDDDEADEGESATLEADDRDDGTSASRQEEASSASLLERLPFTRGQILASFPPILAILAVVIVYGGGSLWWAVALSVLALAPVTWSGHPKVGRPALSALAAWLPVRVLVAVSLTAVAVDRSDLSPAMSWLTLAALLVVPALELWVREARNIRRLRIRHLRTIRYKNPRPPYQGWMFIVGVVPLWLLLALAVLSLPVWFATTMALQGVLAGIYMVVLEQRLIKAHLRGTAELREAIEAYQPEFVVYFASKTGASYQVGMWMPYFERLGRKFIVVCRYDNSLVPLADLTRSPVILCRTLGSLEDTLVPSVRAAFYVNNGVTNTHYVEHRGLTHIWLNHGDSEKPACFNPVHAIYDKIFAAGQAGVDRYARHGVDIPEAKFEVVGRPQVSGIMRATRPIAEIAQPTVLYAPTWVGPYADTEIYSLPQGADIVRGLLARGCTVVFRAHPLNYKYAAAKDFIRQIGGLLEEDRAMTGRPHLWGGAAEKDMDVKDCFNISDAMISDVSAVVTDYLQSRKPFSVVAVGSNTDRLMREAPVAVASYQLLGDLSNLDRVLDEMLGPDPLADQRDLTRKYYLGDFDDGDPAGPFTAAALSYLDVRIEDDAVAAH